MYKDKGRQREANRQAQQRRRELVREGTKDGEGMTDTEIDKVYQGMTTPPSVTPKRGKDIKCFEDLPADVQSTINTPSEDEAEHKRRTAIAVNYQHQSSCGWLAPRCGGERGNSIEG